jgi:hypothetical protein
MSLSDLLGVQPTEEISVDEYKVKKKAISPFEFANSINYTKEKLIVDDWSEKQYNAFLVNKSMSYSKDTVKIANEMNARPHLDSKMQYDFLLGMVRKAKRYNKWLKPEKEEQLELVKEYFGYNNVKAQEALRILSDEDLAAIEQIMQKGGKL